MLGWQAALMIALMTTLMAHLAKQLAAVAPSQQALGQGVARVGVGHSVSGNPMRFGHGELRVVPDQEWRQALPWRSRFEVSLRSYAGLRRYGYIGDKHD